MSPSEDDMPDMTSRGDAAQIRRIIEQVFDAERDFNLSPEEIDRRIEDKVQGEIKSAMNGVKLWVLGGVVANLIPIAVFAYQFGQYAQTISSALTMVKDQQETLTGRGAWMGTMEGRVGSLETWAEKTGYSAPKERALPR